MKLGMEVGTGPGNIVLDGETARPSPKKGHSPNFRPMSIVAKRSPISATAEHLLVNISTFTVTTVIIIKTKPTWLQDQAGNFLNRL